MLIFIFLLLKFELLMDSSYNWEYLSFILIHKYFYDVILWLECDIIDKYRKS